MATPDQFASSIGLGAATPIAGLSPQAEPPAPAPVAPKGLGAAAKIPTAPTLDVSTFVPDVDVSTFVPDAPRGALSEITHQLVGGARVELPSMVGQALQYASDPGNTLFNIGATIRKFGEDAAPQYEPAPEEHGLITNTLASGARMIAPSVSIPAVAALALEPLGLGALATTAATAVVGGAAFGASQGQQTLERGQAAGLPPEEAISAARKTATIEGAGESLGTYFGAKMFGMARNAIFKEKTVANAIKSAVDSGAWKPFVKQLPQTLAIEGATEYGQGYGEAAVEKDAGIKQEATPNEQGVQGFVGALAMTALLAPFGLAGFAGMARSNAKAATALQSPNASVEQRTAAAEKVRTAIAEVNPEAAKVWKANSDFAITNKFPITIDESFTKEGAAVPPAPIVQEAPAAPTPEEAHAALVAEHTAATQQVTDLAPALEQAKQAHIDLQTQRDALTAEAKLTPGERRTKEVILKEKNALGAQIKDAKAKIEEIGGQFNSAKSRVAELAPQIEVAAQPAAAVPDAAAPTAPDAEYGDFLKGEQVDLAHLRQSATEQNARGQNYTQAEQQRRDADWAAADAERRDQMVAQADALTRAQGFDTPAPTAMQLAMQAAQQRRATVTALVDRGYTPAAATQMEPAQAAETIRTAPTVTAAVEGARIAAGGTPTAAPSPKLQAMSQKYEAAKAAGDNATMRHLAPQINELKQKAVERAPTQMALSLGSTPGDAEPITVKDGVVHVGKYAATNFDTGADVTVPTDATPVQIRDALQSAGVIASHQKVFGLGKQERTVSRSLDELHSYIAETLADKKNLSDTKKLEYANHIEASIAGITEAARAMPEADRRVLVKARVDEQITSAQANADVKRDIVDHIVKESSSQNSMGAATSNAALTQDVFDAMPPAAQAAAASAYNATMRERGTALRGQLRGIIGDQPGLLVTTFSARPGESIGAYTRTGPYKAVISMAVNAKDKLSVADHEGYHFAENHLLTGGERKVVANAMKEGKPLFEQLKQRLLQYDRENQTNLTDEVTGNPAEARAYGFELWRRGELTAEGALARAWQKLQQFFERISNAVRGLGFTSIEDVFMALDRGQMAERQMGSGAESSANSMGADYLQTPEFKRWFGGSKVVDAEGKPLVVYHGTGVNVGGRGEFISGDFSAFDADLSGKSSKTGAPSGTFFFTDNPEVASSYTVQWRGDFSDKLKENANVMPVYIALKNPLKVSARGENWREILYKGEYRDVNEIAKLAKESGKYDGVIVTRVKDHGVGKTSGAPSTTYIAFDPKQIKSAIGNTGAFDPNNPDIRFSKASATDFFRQLGIAAGTTPQQVEAYRQDVQMAQTADAQTGLPVWSGQHISLLSPRDVTSAHDVFYRPLGTEQAVKYDLHNNTGRKVGHVVLELDGNWPTKLLDIEVNSEDRGKGYAENAVAGITADVGELGIWHIVPDARGWWDRLGAAPTDAYHGVISFNEYADARSARENPRSLEDRVAAGQTLFSKAATELDNLKADGGAEPAQMYEQYANIIEQAHIPADILTRSLGLAKDSVRGLSKWWRDEVSTPNYIASNSAGFKNVYQALNTYNRHSAILNRQLVQEKLPSWYKASDANQKAAFSVMLKQSAKEYTSASPELAEMLRGLTPDQKTLYTQARGMIDGVLRQQFESQKEQYKSWLTSPGAYEKWEANRQEQVTNMIDRGYVPFRRYGDFSVTTFMETPDGKRVKAGLEFFDSHSAASAAAIAYAREIERSGTALKVEVGTNSRNDRDTGVSIGQFLGTLQRQGIEITQEQRERLVLAMTNADSLVRTQMMHRQGLPGYSTDSMRVLHDFGVHTTQEIAYASFAHVMDAALAGTEVVADVNSITSKPIISIGETFGKREDGQANNMWERDGPMSGVYRDRANELADAVLSPGHQGAWATKLKTMSVMYFIGGSLSGAAVNTLSIPMLLVPQLSMHTNYLNATTTALKTWKDAWQHYSVLHDMEKMRNPDAQTAATLDAAGISKEMRAAIVAASDHIFDTEIHMMLGLSRGTLYSKSKNLQRAAEVWMAPFRVTEQTNRLASFMAAYKLASTGEGVKQADGSYKRLTGQELFRFASDTVDATQNNYSVSNRPGLMNSPVGALMFQFKSFPLFMIEAATLMYKQNPKSAVYMLLGLTAFSGVQGLPFAEEILNLIDVISQQVFGSPFNSRRAMRNAVKTASDAIGAGDMSNVVMRGLINEMTGYNVATRVSGGLLPGTRIGAADATEGRVLSDLAGAPYSMVKDTMSSVGGFVSGVATGDWMQAADALRSGGPIALRNAVKGAEQLSSGYASDSQGRKVADVSTLDGLFQMTGLSTAKVTSLQDHNSIVAQTKAFYTQVSQDMQAQLVKAYRSGDTAKQKEIMELRNKWNEQNPNMPIMPNPAAIRRAIMLANVPLDKRAQLMLSRRMRNEFADMEQ